MAIRGLLVVIFTYGAKSFFEDYRKELATELLPRRNKEGQALH
jgi:hypothetical protein